METGERGEGGDRTLEIDAAAEEAVFAELERLHEAGARFTVVSEERGTVDFGGDGTLVVVDPIDGSLNAKRGLPHHALSIAVAEGPTMADVVFGFVHDLGPGEEWVAERGAGAMLDGVPLDPSVGERRWARRQARAGRHRVGRPALGARGRRGAGGDRHRLRAMGTIAVTLCQVAAARFDGMADADGLPRGRRRGRAADRARGGRPRRLHGLRGPARRAARPARARRWSPRTR